MLPIDPAHADTDDEAIAWFGETLADGEWINHSWIGRSGAGELRIVDVVCTDATHRLLYRISPSIDATSRWDGMDYERMQEFVDRLVATARKHDFIVAEFACAATTIPWIDEYEEMTKARQAEAPVGVAL